MSEEFEPHLGRIGSNKSRRSGTYLRSVLDYAYKSGMKSGRKSSFTGSRIGRGRAFGTLAGAGLVPGGQRRVIVKGRIAKLKSGNLAAARAHMRYIQREGVTQEGEVGKLYGRETDEADGSAFVEHCDGDRHQFRFIVSADDATEIGDLKPFIRELMQKVESDLETRLDWVAVDHFNTGHPHTHIVIRGKAEDGKDLIIAKDYISHGIRQRAAELLTLELGPENEFDMRLKLAREVDADRFTKLDRSILRHMEKGLLVVSALPPSDPSVHAAQMSRLRKLEDLGLASERQTGVWEIDPNTEQKLRSLGQRGDIIKTIHRAMREAGIDRAAGNFTIHDTSKQQVKLIGCVAGLGLTDEISDRYFVVIDGVDGKAHYADMGQTKPELLPEKGMIVSLEAANAGENNRQRIRLQILSYLKLENLVETEGATWLDKELASKVPIPIMGQGFGADVKTALRNRMQWLTERGFAQQIDGGIAQPSAASIAELGRRELQRAAVGISVRSGLGHANPLEGEQFSGTYKHAANLASGKFAIIENAKEFVLVPWKPSLEDFKGKVISGTANNQGISWDWGSRKKSLGIS
jgi:type IV secretory pathway VirD2 relaxase